MNNNKVYSCLTLYQPWATWIIRGWKTIETRTHDRFSSLKGKTILIHAGMTTDSSDAVIHNPYLTREQILFNPDEVVNGAILGGAYVSGFMPLNSTNSKDALIDCASEIRYGLLLSNITKFEQPIPVKGEMGIWYFDLEKKQKVKKPLYQPIIKL